MHAEGENMLGLQLKRGLLFCFSPENGCILLKLYQVIVGKYHAEANVH